MTITEQAEGSLRILTLSGALDTVSSGDLTRSGLSHCVPGVTAIVVDLSDVPYVTSAGFRAFIAIMRQGAPGGTKFVLCGLNDVVRDLFEASGLMKAFTIAAGRAEAVSAFSGG